MKIQNIFFVDDGSKDGTLSVLKELSGVCDRVNYVSFSRNFGKEAALYAGLKQAKGDYVAVNGRGSSGSTRVISSNEIYTR